MSRCTGLSLSLPTVQREPLHALRDVPIADPSVGDRFPVCAFGMTMTLSQGAAMSNKECQVMGGETPYVA